MHSHYSIFYDVPGDRQHFHALDNFGHQIEKMRNPQKQSLKTLPHKRVFHVLQWYVKD